ncbi:MAG: hypothetical protein ACOCQ1_04465 [Halanaerobiaceae bacterium]
MGKTNIKKEIPFYITMSYFLSFVLIRLMVILADSGNSEFARAAKMGELPSVNFYLGSNIILFGYHIHHFYFGIAMICIAAWLAIVDSDLLSRKHIAILYGAGLGLFMDEVGLLLTWGNYNASSTYILSLLLIGIFLNIVFFPYFWRNVRQNLVETSRNQWMFTKIFNDKSFMGVVDNMVEETGKTEKTSLVFTGSIFIIAGFLILLYPSLVVYWVAGGFLVQGVSSLVQAWQK